MTVRNLETRLAKLESNNRPENSRFLIWYHGEPQPAFAAARHLFPDTSDAIMAEWQSNDPLPRNRWVSDIKRDLTDAERKHIEGKLQRYAEPAGNAERETWSPQLQAQLTEMTDTELWFEILKVNP